ncbi:ATP-dependent RecD-like DNA helicase [uncultured Tyzzerella sp.]|uniref:SF1B family DNA helicase RecD2 n=1 Tax=uncultured Tyzzerella sp. TaxID=2321398 RepID=UPI0029420F92|nr:ATP-dependent RecD-like DNA helicase [uncultured Tyzzerella sp.]
MEEIIKIEGPVENIIYKNEENGYIVFSIYSEEYGDIFPEAEITCVGYVANLNVGENIILTGSVINHSAYGKQFKVDIYEKSIPKTEKGIKKYLESGAIKGIGKTIAERIVEKFGEDTLNIIEKKPEKLSQIKGISVKKAMEIGEIFAEQEGLRKAIIYLQGYGITAVFAMKIYKHFKENTIRIIETNPYRLSDEMFGVGFKIVDNIAEKIGIEKESEYRIKAGIKYILNHSANGFGNVYLPEHVLIQESKNILGVSEDILLPNLFKLQMERQICVEKTENGNIVFLNSYYYAESYVAKKILQLAKNKTEYSKNYDMWIKNIEKDNNIVLANNQKQAIKEAMVNGVLVITGGPGTGKTTTINSIISMFKNEGYEIELCAPTGRAAKRMSEATGLDAQTIHRLLGINFLQEDKKRQSFEKDEDMPIEADVIIVDECSMIDILLMNGLLKAVANGTRLILVGDVDQLPSVGAGNVLKDIINSDCIKVVRLNEIFRQARESAIVMNAHRINNGQYPVLNEVNKDFFFLRRHNMDDLNNTIIELITKRLPKFLNISDLRTIQVLAPMKKSPIGIENLNNILQNAINPPSEDKNEKDFKNLIFREGDKVMQIKNNYSMDWKIIKDGIYIDEGMGIFNGDEGIIRKIDNKNEFIEVIFDDCKHIKYDFTQLDELSLSYAITIHKSQGSEYKAIIMPIHSGAPMLLTRNLLYTGVTRAKELAVIVGVESTLNKMVDNDREVSRYTYLKDRIINLSKFI